MQLEPLDLSIVIVNYNAKNYLRNCLLSILSIPRNFTYEIIVVDNKSLDGGVEMIKDEFSDIRLIENQSNKGFSAANNQGARVSRGKNILLLNNDTIIPSGSLETMISIMDKNPGVGLLGCRLKNGDGTLQQSFGKSINFFYDFFRKYITNLYWKRKNHLIGKYLIWRHDKSKEVAWVKGACMLVRRQALFDVDLMDENFFVFFEEVDLSLRIRQLGWKILYTPSAEIIHFGGVSTSTLQFRSLIEYRKSQLYFYKKHYGKTGETLIRLYFYAKIFKTSLLYEIKKRFTNGSSEELEFYRNYRREILDILNPLPASPG